MKSTYSRRYRRSVSRSTESVMFKKDSQQEPAFFAPASTQSFFKPNIISRKCDHCEAEEKSVKRTGEKKEEEKPVMKMDEKKEEDKAVHKMDDKKEEEKAVHKMDDKKEEDKAIHKMDDKKEEDKAVHKMDDKKEEDKAVHKMGEKKEEDKAVHKMGEKKEDDKKVAAKSEAAVKSGNNSNAATYINSLPGKGNSLPGDTLYFFKRRMGYDFANVKIHTDAAAQHSARELSAKAYAVDNNIVFNKGQYNPASREGKKLLAHELTHIAQHAGNGQTVMKSTDELLVNRKEEHSTNVNSQVKSVSVPQKVAFGCGGVNVQGQTDANYTSSFSTTEKSKPSSKCESCEPPECIAAHGTITSKFLASPVVTLPDVPSGLSDCESTAVSKFINGTLKKHEYKHVAAFKTYNGTVKTPYKFNGCQSDLEGYVKSIHEHLSTKRADAANAKSDKLDPFNKPIPCNCKD